MAVFYASDKIKSAAAYAGEPYVKLRPPIGEDPGSVTERQEANQSKSCWGREQERVNRA